MITTKDIQKDYTICTIDFASFQECFRTGLRAIPSIIPVAVSKVGNTLLSYFTDTKEFNLDALISAYNCDTPVISHNLLQGGYQNYIDCVETTTTILTSVGILDNIINPAEPPRTIGSALLLATYMCKEATIFTELISASINAIIPVEPCAIIDDTTHMQELVCLEEYQTCLNSYDGFFIL